MRDNTTNNTAVKPSAIPATPERLARIATGDSWQSPPHIVLIFSALAVALTTPGSRLLICMPPRHGKSESASRFAPAWKLGMFPDSRVILASYEADYAEQWGRKVRAILEEYGPSLFGVSVSHSSRSASRWNIEGHRGGMQTAGVGGPITGKGADLLIIDDPIKNAEDAASKTMRDKAWDWYQSTAYTRLEPGASLVLIQTRWHEDDLAGRILASDEASSWTKLVLPAIAEENDAIGRKPGESLWPERYGEKALDTIRKTVGRYVWNALYQQRPSSLEGGIFRKSYFREFTIEGDIVTTPYGSYPMAEISMFATADLAVSVKTSSDFTVIGVWGLAPRGELLLFELLRERMEGPDIVPAIRRLADRWGVAWVGIESVAFQVSVVQQARRDGLACRKLIPKGDKVARATAASVRFEAGLVCWRKGFSWIDDLEEELITFPNGTHDDQVDMVSYACIEASKIKGTIPQELPPKEDEEEATRELSRMDDDRTYSEAEWLSLVGD